jgi:hypothetical protein
MTDIVEMAVSGKRKSVIARLGVAADILEVALKVGEVIKDVSFDVLKYPLLLFTAREAPSRHQDHAK